MEKQPNKYSKENFKKFFGVATWTFKKMFQLAPTDSTLLIIFIILAASMPTATAYAGARLLDELIKLVGNEQILHIREIVNINQPYMQFLVLTASLSFLGYLIRTTQRFFRNKFKAFHIRTQENELYLKISNLDISKFEDSKAANDIIKARDNLWKLRDFFEVGIQFLGELIGTIVSGAVVMNFSPLLGCFLILTSIPGGVISIIYIRKWYEYYDNNIDLFKKRGWTQSYLTGEEDVKQNRVLKSDTVLKKFLFSITNILNPKEYALRKQEYKQNFFLAFLDLLVDLFVPIAILVSVISGQISIGQYTFYTGRSRDFANRFQGIIDMLSQLFDDSLGIIHVKTLMETDNEIVSGNRKINRALVPKIEFKNVWFKYPNTNVFALKNINMTINPCEEIAIVGENGAGKTTLIKLLLRLYDVTRGEILINGFNIKEINLRDYYTVVGTLFQDYDLYKMMSIKENISIGVSKNFSNKKMIEAAKLAQIHDFIISKEKKYDTLLSKQFSGGIKVSTGQSQKIALARMFYRDSPVLIFDEPTASIDPTSEYHIFKRIYQFMRNKTVIIISHKFSTVRNAQKIYVMNNGRIAESGSHKELIEKQGVYADAFLKQAEGYTKQD